MFFKRLETHTRLTLTLAALMLMSSCVPGVNKSSLRTRDSITTAATSNVATNQGLVLSDNPIALSGISNLSDSFDLNKLLINPGIITTGSFLSDAVGNCSGLTYCFEVKENKDSTSALQTYDGKWAYNANTAQFLQVNTFYHLGKLRSQFTDNLTNHFNQAIIDSGSVAYKYDTSMPLTEFSSMLGYSMTDRSFLHVYANCDAPDNASFERSTNSLCFGYLQNYPKVKWAQDSTVIYHEAGHYLQRLQLNMRNSGTVKKAEMGNFSYDEAGALGEGLSDYFSYYLNGRSHFAEWAAGRFLGASRPMSEDDSLHTIGVSTASGERLAYPDYITYDPNNSSIPIEDIHVAGMSISHYLVALTKDIQTQCVMNHKDAANIVMKMISETLAEHGDLTGKGTEKNTTGTVKVNLSTNESYAFDWNNKVNPINYRSFSQTLAKNLNNLFNQSPTNHCNGNSYPKDKIESLLDDYGLLLFRTYNEHRNLAVPASPTYTNTVVSSINRKKSVLISKNLLIFDPAINASQAYVIDNQAQVRSAISSLQGSGLISALSTQTPSDLGFNNGNGRVSPGEVVGLALNLYNNSNATMGGIQILANDWKHADYTDAAHPGKPCQLGNSTSDKWPLESEGGSKNAVCSTAAASSDATDFAPICFIQYNTSTSTQWVSQKEYKTKIALNDSLCLDPTNTKSCFIRAIKGADQAYYSKLNAKSNWTNTMKDPANSISQGLGLGNLLFFEVSKHLPPGAVVDCRMRVRFTNCEECFHDSSRDNYDYKDVDYNGATPFKQVHLQMTITD